MSIVLQCSSHFWLAKVHSALTRLVVTKMCRPSPVVFDKLAGFHPRDAISFVHVVRPIGLEEHESGPGAANLIDAQSAT